MDVFYSQHGEDFLLNKIFGGKREGYYVEIGCLDGIEFSNTYYFEKKGWKGLCVEAHKDFIAALKINRPNATVVHAAVGEEDKDKVTFYANKVGSLSTLDRNEEERWKTNYAPYFHGFEEQTVRMRTLTSIFDEVKPGQIDFVSLDIEGYEVQALSGMDFGKYKPRIFIIEYKDDQHRAQIEKYLLPQGYHFLARLGCNMFYSLKPEDGLIVNARYGTIPLLQVELGGAEIWHTATQLRPTLGRRIKSAIKRTPVGPAWRYIYGRYETMQRNRRMPSYEEKRKIIDGYRQRFSLSTMVETGTYLGDTIEYFSDKFSRLYSIELSEQLFADAVKRFAGRDHIRILQGDSGQVLQALVKEINSPALFWLDGHYSYKFFVGDRFITTAKGNKVTPVMDELKVLLNDPHTHVILIDDARLFNGTDDYPTLAELTDFVKSQNSRYDIEVRRDIIRLSPK